MTSFMRDLPLIRKQALKRRTIQHAFRDSGIWPVSAKAGIKKMRAYQRSNTQAQDNQDQDSDSNLPKLPPTRAKEV